MEDTKKKSGLEERMADIFFEIEEPDEKTDEKQGKIDQEKQ
jgi:hypothetical protein